MTDGDNKSVDRVITVSRRVVRYKPIEVNVVDFLVNSEADLIFMRETESIEIRLPSKYGDYTNYVGHINVSDLKRPLGDILNDIYNQGVVGVIAEHQHEIVFNKDALGCARISHG